MSSLGEYEELKKYATRKHLYLPKTDEFNILAEGSYRKISDNNIDTVVPDPSFRDIGRQKEDLKKINSRVLKWKRRLSYFDYISMVYMVAILVVWILITEDSRRNISEFCQDKRKYSNRALWITAASNICMILNILAIRFEKALIIGIITLLFLVLMIGKCFVDTEFLNIPFISVNLCWNLGIQIGYGVYYVYTILSVALHLAIAFANGYYIYCLILKNQHKNEFDKKVQSLVISSKIT